MSEPTISGLTVVGPPRRSRVRQPRGLVRINGDVFDFTAWEVDNNRFYDADTFSCTLPVSAMVAGRDTGWLLETGELLVEIFAGFPTDPDSFTSGELDSLIYGRVDDLEWSVDGLEVTLSGRDLTGEMIDTKTSEKYPNKTASEIATTLAAKYGLTPKVKATTTKVGKYYQTDQVRLQAERTEWDLLTWLAREEGFQVYVLGRELHFAPETADADPVTFDYTPATSEEQAVANQVRIRFSQSKTLARDIKVIVKSRNMKSNRTFTKTATGKSGRGKVQEYTRIISGLTADQAQARAKQILAELTAHEMKLAIDGPATSGLKIGDRIQLTGTGTRADQIYFPDSITREMDGSDQGGGYSWSIRAKNHSPESEPNL